MHALKQFYETTVALIALLEKDGMERDEKIAEAAELLEKRERFLQEIKPPFSPQEMALGKELASLNEKVELLLLKEKNEIQRNMQRLKKQKETNDKYTNPYESLLTVEGGFYDKRK